jgi:hypothetical protein
VLLVEHASLPIPAHRVLCTIVASLLLTAENQYTASREVTVPRPSDRSVFIDVPARTAAVVFSASSSGAPAFLDFISPNRDLYSGPYPPTKEPVAFPNPTPGIWEVNVCNNDVRTFDESATKAPKPLQVTVTATAFLVDVEASPSAEWTRAEAAVSFPVRLTNRFGKATAVKAEGALGSAFRASRTIRQGEQHAYEIIVPQGARSLRAKIDVAEGSADLDLYLLDCTGSDNKLAKPYKREEGGKAPARPKPLGVPRAKAAGVQSGGVVEITDPAPGRWVVVVDAYRVPGGSVKYEYLDAYTHPSFGALAVLDTPEDRAAGSDWKVPGHTWTSSLPMGPRTLYGRIAVTSPHVMRTFAILADLGVNPRPLPVTLGGLDLIPDGTSALIMKEGACSK